MSKSKEWKEDLSKWVQIWGEATASIPWMALPATRVMWALFVYHVDYQASILYVCLSCIRYLTGMKDNNMTVLGADDLRQAVK